MNRNALIIAIIVIIIAAAAIAAAVKNQNNNGSATSEASASPSASSSAADVLDATASPTTGETATPAASNVTIQDMSFSPATLNIKKGTTVTWTNNDSVAHTVTSDTSGSGPSSSQLNNGDTYSFTFDTVGTFSYHCSNHPSMKGTVVVTE